MVEGQSDANKSNKRTFSYFPPENDPFKHSIREVIDWAQRATDGEIVQVLQNVMRQKGEFSSFAKRRQQGIKLPYDIEKITQALLQIEQKAATKFNKTFAGPPIFIDRVGYQDPRAIVIAHNTELFDALVSTLPEELRGQFIPKEITTTEEREVVPITQTRQRESTTKKLKTGYIKSEIETLNIPCIVREAVDRIPINKDELNHGDRELACLILSSVSHAENIFKAVPALELVRNSASNPFKRRKDLIFKKNTANFLVKSGGFPEKMANILAEHPNLIPLVCKAGNEILTNEKARIIESRTEGKTFTPSFHKRPKPR